LSSILYIFLGLLITYGTYFLVIWGLTSLYYWISHEEMNIARDLMIAATLAGIGLLSTLVGMIAFSSLGAYLFAVALALLSFVGYSALLKYFWRFSSFDAVTIATTLAIILNPAWLHLIGIL